LVRGKTVPYGRGTGNRSLSQATKQAMRIVRSGGEDWLVFIEKKKKKKKKKKSTRRLGMHITYPAAAPEKKHEVSREDR